MKVTDTQKDELLDFLSKAQEMLSQENTKVSRTDNGLSTSYELLNREMQTKMVVSLQDRGIFKPYNLKLAVKSNARMSLADVVAQAKS